MKSIPPALSGHIAGNVTNLAMCWRIRRQDGIVLGLTTHDRDLVIDTVVYRAGGGFTPSMISSSIGFNVDNLDISGALSSASIEERDLREGRFDRARIEIFLVNWQDVDQGKIILKSGYLGEVETGEGSFNAEVRGLLQSLQQTIGEVYSPECRADLGDNRCKVALSGFRHLGRVMAVLGQSSFSDTSLTPPDGWFDYGILHWITGENAGLAMEVKKSAGDQVTLYQPMIHPLAAGDLYEMTAGCDKRLTTCINKFANVENFRGEPFVPGSDSVLDYPGLR